MSRYAPRPYPLPSLENVPHEYVVNKLNEIASSYWCDVASADCMIIIPALRKPNHSPSLSSCAVGKGDGGRRATEPSSLPRDVYYAHMDYLVTQSMTLRSILGGTNPLHLITPIIRSQPPQILPSDPTRPIIYIPVPDPTSFGLILHWIYFGELEVVECALNDKSVSWQGLATNAIYLGLQPTLLEFVQAWKAFHDAEEEDNSDETDDEGERGEESIISREESSDDEWLPPGESHSWRGRSRRPKRLF